MNNYFIENIEIKENKYIQKLEISLSKEKRRHLIFTGKNGSGKTTTLKEINILLNKLINNGFTTVQNNINNIKSFEKATIQQNNQIENYKKQIEQQNNQKN